MNKAISETTSSDCGGMFVDTSVRQYTFFEWLQNHETEPRCFAWLAGIWEFLRTFSKGMEDGKALFRKYGRE
jgi:hypothetical protein